MNAINKDNFVKILEANGFEITTNDNGDIEGTLEVKYGNKIETAFINNSDVFIIWKPNGTKKFYSGKTYAQARNIIMEVIKWWK